MLCMYCGRELSMSIHFSVRKAVKPPYQKNRWLKIGICCEQCEQEGNKTQIEFGEGDE